jgi:hypothetical protein
VIGRSRVVRVGSRVVRAVRVAGRVAVVASRVAGRRDARTRILISDRVAGRAAAGRTAKSS